MPRYYTKDGKTKLGPDTDQQLRELARAGYIGPSDMLKREGMGKWMWAGEIAWLFPIPNPTTASDAGAEVGMGERLVKAAETADRLHSLYLKLVAGACALSGFVGMLGDFLRPITALNFIAFAVMSLLTVFLLILWIRRV